MGAGNQHIAIGCAGKQQLSGLCGFVRVRINGAVPARIQDKNGVGGDSLEHPNQYR